MKKTITTLLVMLLIVPMMRADDTIIMDTLSWSELSPEVQKRVNEAMKQAEERLKKAEESLRKAEKSLSKHGHGKGDTTIYSYKWYGKLHDLPKGFLGEDETIDLPKDQKPLIDLSAMKGQNGIEDYYFSGDILHAQARRKGDFFLGGWNILPLLHRLSGLLILKSKKKAGEKQVQALEERIRKDARFQPIVHHKGITIYGHRNAEDLMDEVILLHVPSSSTDSRIIIVQMMGLLRPDDLMSYAQLCDAPLWPKRTKN